MRRKVENVKNQPEKSVSSAVIFPGELFIDHGLKDFTDYADFG